MAVSNVIDQVGILAAAEDYVQGWYQANPARTRRASHPELVKRRLNEQNGLDLLDAPTLVSYVEGRIGKTPPATQLQQIEILGVYGNIASVRAEMNDWVDFLHLGYVDGEWKIINVLWALKPKGAAAVISNEQSPVMKVSDAIRAKRAVRNYRAEPVPDEIIEAILKAGRRAQSSKNDQPWTFVVISTRDQLQLLSTAGAYAKHMATSAFTVVLVAPARYEFDLGQAAAYMQLAAIEHGVGSCVTVLHDHDAARRILGVPEELTCHWTITFGYPAEAPAPLKAGGRRPLTEMVRRERYS